MAARQVISGHIRLLIAAKAFIVKDCVPAPLMRNDVKVAYFSFANETACHSTPPYKSRLGEIYLPGKTGGNSVTTCAESSSVNFSGLP